MKILIAYLVVSAVGIYVFKRCWHDTKADFKKAWRELRYIVYKLRKKKSADRGAGNTSVG